MEMMQMASPIPWVAADRLARGVGFALFLHLRWRNRVTERRLKIDAEEWKDQVVGCGGTAAVGPVARHVRRRAD